jgi:nucleotidyltransferase/DNA polymerase involved in DNA repair
MVACILIPAFELQAALRDRPRLGLRPAALAPLPGKEPILGPVNATAEAAGVSSGMRLGEALALCPSIALIERDPHGVEEQWEQIVRRLEDSGFAVEPVEPGCLYFDTRGVERLYGGVSPALRRALSAVGTSWTTTAGAADRRFAALAAAAIARPGQAVVVDDDRTNEFLAPLPLTLLPLEPRRREELDRMGVKKIGQLAGLPGSAVAERLGPDGRRAWSLARNEGDNAGIEDNARVTARTPVVELAERLDFPEAIANELTLRRALTALLDRILARPERGGREIRRSRLGATRRWRLVASHRDAPRAERGAGNPAGGARAEARGAPRAGAHPRHRATRARRVPGPPARARPPRRQCLVPWRDELQTVSGRTAPGTCRRRRRSRLQRRRGRAVVADPGAARAARSRD